MQLNVDLMQAGEVVAEEDVFSGFVAIRHPGAKHSGRHRPGDQDDFAAPGILDPIDKVINGEGAKIVVQLTQDFLRLRAWFHR